MIDDVQTRLVVNVERLRFSYGDSRPLLNDLRLRVAQSDRVGLVGPMGSGKSTLLFLIMGLLRPDAGRIRLFGRDMNGESDFAKTRTRIGFLFQNPDDQLFCPTVLEDVAFGPLNQGVPPDEARDKARRALAELDIADLTGQVTHRLSGGQKRLVALASILVMEPALLLLDEPVGGLDADARKRFIDLLNGLPLPILAVSHDWDFLCDVANRYLTLTNGKLEPVEGPVTHAHLSGNVPHSHQV